MVGIEPEIPCCLRSLKYDEGLCLVYGKLIHSMPEKCREIYYAPLLPGR